MGREDNPANRQPWFLGSLSPFAGVCCCVEGSKALGHPGGLAFLWAAADPLRMTALYKQSGPVPIAKQSEYNVF